MTKPETKVNVTFSKIEGPETTRVYMSEVKFKSLVTADTEAKSWNLQSFLDGLNDKIFIIPDYQRDSDQWDIPKKSLFMESIINRLTVPPIIVFPEVDEERGVEINSIIDGQQRVSTLEDFVKDKFALASEDDVEYADNVGAIIQGKKFSELPPSIQNQINRYQIILIKLPHNLNKSLRLMIFKRINEGGVPLSAQDLRLAEFGDNAKGALVRLAGVYDPERKGSARMIASAFEKYGVKYPWKSSSAWFDWWSPSKLAIGQTPSEMFLQFIIAKELEKVETLLKSNQQQEVLDLKFDGTTTSVLDIVCAQFLAEKESKGANIFPEVDVFQAYFNIFEDWFNTLKAEKIPRLSVNSSSKVAYFIAAASKTWPDKKTVVEEEWEKIHLFLTKGPGEIEEKLGKKYPIPKGKWNGQRKQILATFEICNHIKKAV